MVATLILIVLSAFLVLFSVHAIVIARVTEKKLALLDKSGANPGKKIEVLNKCFDELGSLKKWTEKSLFSEEPKNE